MRSEQQRNEFPENRLVDCFLLCADADVRSRLMRTRNLMALFIDETNIVNTDKLIVKEDERMLDEDRMYWSCVLQMSAFMKWLTNFSNFDDFL